MQPYLIEGIVIGGIPFREKDLIVQLFSPKGVLSLFVAGGAKVTKTSIAPSPLMRIECLLVPSQRGMAKAKEISLIDGYLRLRDTLPRLTCALEIIQAIKKTQLEQKPSEQLYKLTQSFLEALKTQAPGILLASFYLKLLRHEGLFALPKMCTQCHAPLHSLFIFERESYCLTCAPKKALYFSEAERLQLTTLAMTRSLKTLSLLSVPKTLLEKVQKLFEQSAFFQ